MKRYMHTMTYMALFADCLCLSRFFVCVCVYNVTCCFLCLPFIRAFAQVFINKSLFTFIGIPMYYPGAAVPVTVLPCLITVSVY